jgi:hypothetical protein
MNYRKNTLSIADIAFSNNARYFGILNTTTLMLCLFYIEGSQF